MMTRTSMIMAGMVLAVAWAALAFAQVDPPRLREAGDWQYVIWRGQPILELYQGRCLRFRATPDNDHWIGIKSGKGSDGMIALTWADRDEAGYEVRDFDYQSSPDSFQITLDAHKAQSNSDIHTVISARLLSQEMGFEYDLATRLQTTASAWRSVHMKSGPKGPRTIQPIDYHLERVTLPTRLRSIQDDQDDLYQGFVRSEDGQQWTFVPKMHVPTHPLPQGIYLTQNFRGELPPSPAGSYFGALDEQEGGWMTQVIEATLPLRFTLCWMFNDVHCYMPQAVPEVTPDADAALDLKCAIRFTPVTPQHARQLLAEAVELPWRDLLEYQVPPFSRHNTFARIIHSNEQCWNKSDNTACLFDQTTGYDDSSCISIKKVQDDGLPALWYGWCWGPAYDQKAPLDGVYRFSAMIKTSQCDGSVRLGVNEFYGDNWFGRHKPGRWDHPDSCVITYADQELTGDNDWTRVSIDLPIDDEKIRQLLGRSVSYTGIRRTVFIEQTGTGQCWIDNVQIQKLEQP